MALPLDQGTGLPLDPGTLQALQEQRLAQETAYQGGGAAQRMDEQSLARAANSLFPNLQMRQAQGAQQALAGAQLTQDQGESDLDFSIRQMRAQRDALATVSPEAAAAVNTKLLLAGEAKFQQDHLKAQDQRLQDADTRANTEEAAKRATGINAHLVGPNGKVLGTFDLADPDQRAAYLKAKSTAPQGTYTASDSDMLKLQELHEKDQTELAKAARSGAGALGAFGDDKVEALLASMASKGVNLPTGFRSKAQMLATFQGLLKKYDGLTTDDIADLVGRGIIDFKAVGKATQTAAGILGRVNVAAGELDAMTPIARDASAGVSRSDFVPYNRLQQMVKAGTSSPEQKRLYIATQSVLNAYDVLAARGGTDKNKRELQHHMLETADGPEAYNTALDQIEKEVQAAHAGALSAIRAGTYGATEQANLHAQESGNGPPTPVGPGPHSQAGQAPPSFKSEADVPANFPKGTKVIIGGVPGTWQ